MVQIGEERIGRGKNMESRYSYNSQSTHFLLLVEKKGVTLLEEKCE